MKTALFFSLALAMLTAGCSTEASITKDGTSPENDATVYFYLRDGSYIRSQPGEHPRLEGGYQVTGELYFQDQSSDMFWTGISHRTFSGRVSDKEIRLVTQKKANQPVGAAIVAVTVGAIMQTGQDEATKALLVQGLSDPQYPLATR